jgi:hypothetical protein
MTEKRHCPECNYHLDDYAENETLCGACYNATTQHKYEAPAMVTDELLAAYQLLETAQQGANRWDRAGLGRELDRIRWALGDLYAQIKPLHDGHALNTETGVWELGDSHAFTNATERGN